LTDPKNTSQFVTPDAVCQLSDTYGIIGEVKLTASSDQDFAQAQKQLLKYDQPLHGWMTPTKKIPKHDLSLLVNDLEKNRVKAFFKDKKYAHNLTLVACARQLQVNEIVKIEKYDGFYADPKLEQKMSNPIPVPLERVVRTMSSVKFYDTEPLAVEYTMNVLWMCVFNEFAAKDTGKKHKEEITVDLAEAVRMLKSRFAFHRVDNMQPESPRTEWVRKALNTFISIGYATRKSSDQYIVKYSPYCRHKSMLEVFAKKVFEANKKRNKHDKMQMEMKVIIGEK